MTVFQDAANLNNDGVNALLQGNHDAAIDSMGKAIHLMKKALSRFQMETASHRSDQTKQERLCGNASAAAEDTDRPISSSLPQQQQEINTNSGSSCYTSTDTVEIPTSITNTVDSFLDSGTILFNQAIRIPTYSKIPSDGTEGDDDAARQAVLLPSEFATSIYTGAIIFNLALAHQIKAFSFSQNNGSHEATAPSESHADGQSICMIKAEKLYGMALKLLNGITYLTSHTALLVKLACINNLIQIWYSKGDDYYCINRIIQEDLRQISHFLQISSSSSSSSSSSFPPFNSYTAQQGGMTTILEEPSCQIQDLLLSIFLFKVPGTAAAA